MKKISEKDLIINPETVAQLNSTKSTSNATENQTKYNPTCINHTKKEGFPTCFGHTIGENETCNDCNSDVCQTADDDCEQTLAADTCNITISQGNVCCNAETEKSNCCAFPTSVDVCQYTINNCLTNDNCGAITNDCQASIQICINETSIC